MRNCQKAFTLVEMLVVVAVTVVLMLALVQVFDFVGEGISDRRSIIEISGELRAAVMRLQRDLDGVTVTTLPPAEPQAGEGYLEIIEGEWSDRLPVPFVDDLKLPYDIGMDLLGKHHHNQH